MGQIRCKTEDCKEQSCRTCTHRTVDSLIESDEIREVFTEKQVQMLDELFHIHTRELANTVDKWVRTEIIPAIKDWAKDEIYSIIEDKLEKFRDVMQDWVIEDYSEEVQKWIIEEFANAVQGWVYEEALPTFLSKLKFPKLNELVREETETE